jgi:hypothetical protein
MAILATEEDNKGSVTGCRSPVAGKIEPGTVVPVVDQLGGIGPLSNGGPKPGFKCLALSSFSLIFGKSFNE